jgi:hypothetical protein
LSALAHPSADRALWEHGDRPVVVIPEGMAALGNGSNGTMLASNARTAPLTHNASADPDDSNGTMLASDARMAPLTHGQAAPTTAEPADPELTGRVRDRAGRPVDAVLTLVDGGGHQLARGATDGEGAFRLPVGHTAGTGLLIVRGRHAGAAPAVVSVALGTPATHDVDLATDAAHRPGSTLVAGS